jgi:hypothetical protein
MSVTLSLTEAQTFQALGNFLLAATLAGTDVMQAQVNRVPETQAADFVLMNSILQERLSTNVDAYADALFVGSIAGNTLTITAVAYGSLAVGSPVLGVGIAANTSVTALGTGTGGIGTYTGSGAPQTIASRAIAAGVSTKAQPMKVTMQLDVHGPQSADNVALITTLFRDEFGVTQFQSSGFDVTPLYMSEPRQTPFVNDEHQIEQRWVIDAVMQCNPIVTVPQQFADVLALSLIEVDARYPPS